jgi:hypothetical protein
MLRKKHWGCDKDNLRVMYSGIIRDGLEYAGGVWIGGACDTAITRVKQVQAAAVKAVLGLTRDTNNVVAIREAGEIPISIRGLALAAKHRKKC